MSDQRFDLLFEPVRIGPVTAPNRFYSVPHASGMMSANPRMRAAFRETKAEGGWGVVCTGANSIHPTSDDSPFPCATFWDEADVRSHALMTDAVHRHGALAGIELWHGGAAVMNRTTRTPQLSPSGIPWLATQVNFMGQQRPKIMDRQDIRDLVRWQGEAARRAKSAGFDIVYVYCGMGYLPYQFLMSDYNHRTDAYGGSLENRVRLTRELIDATREATGGACAVALRISLQELRGRPHEGAESEAHAVIALLKDDPDLFDVKMDYSSTDCSPSRFTGEGSHEPVVDFVKRITEKPVVGVGRFTSPDAMVGQIRRGVLDLIGAARPSIADPFLPAKIREGRVDEIRECIGCNICISSWHDGVPVRCTQNPTIGEEWRRGWHPERIATVKGAATALVVGAGPAGLEAALTLARRGMRVALAERTDKAGGRLLYESRLPGLSAWHRVVDWRLGRLRTLENVDLYFDSDLGADDVLEFGAEHVVIATGARWVPMLFSPNEYPLGRLDHPRVLTPSDLAAGAPVEGPVVVYDADNYYLASAIAEGLAGAGHDVTYVTSAGMASPWTLMTNEIPGIHRALAGRGVPIETMRTVEGFDGERVTLGHIFTADRREIACRTLVLVTQREPVTGLYDALAARGDAVRDAGIRSLIKAGDAEAPAALAHIVHQAHRKARELDAAAGEIVFRRDYPVPPERETDPFRQPA